MFEYIKKFFNTNISFLILLTIVVFALYGKSINFEITGLDDDALITENINFISNLKNIPKLFTKSAFYNNTTSYYRPILSCSFAIESFFVRDNLKFYHLTNIILFILSLYLFYLFCMELKLNSIITKILLLLIAVHPMFVSVVVWIPGRNDSLLTLFFVLSFICFIRYVNTQQIKYAILFCLFFVFSLFTKENFIFLITLYFIYLFLYGYNINKKKILFLFLFLIPFILIFFILRKNSVATFDYQYYITNINKFCFYFFKDIFIYFYNFLIPEYIPIILFNASLNLKIVLYNCLFMFVLIFVLYKKMLSGKEFAFSLSLILLSMFPAFLIKENVYLNHRFFICSLAFLIMFVSVLDFLIIKINKAKIFFLLFFVFFFISFFLISYKQADKYRNNETFWINAYIDSPNYYVTCQNLAHIYAGINNVEKAKYYAEKAVELRSNFKTLIDYANILLIIGELDQAEFAFLEIEKDIKIKENKVLIYYPLSEIYYRKKNYEKALEYALKTYNIIPYYINYCEQLIKIYDIMERYKEELEIYGYLTSFDKKNKIYKNKIEELKQKIVNTGVTNA